MQQGKHAKRKITRCNLSLGMLSLNRLVGPTSRTIFELGLGPQFGETNHNKGRSIHRTSVDRFDYISTLSPEFIFIDATLVPLFAEDIS